MPGLFSGDQWTLAQWEVFWRSNDMNEIIPLLQLYRGKQLYIYVGSSFPISTQRFNRHECFELIEEKRGSKLYKFVC